MLVKEVMTKNVEYLPADTSIEAAAKIMAGKDCGFLPIADKDEEKLQGVITDRDIAIRAVAEGMDPAKTSVQEIRTSKVLYCYEGDDLASVAGNMQDNEIWRIIVLNNAEDKQLAGILTVGDILRNGEKQIAADVAKGIMKAA